MTLPISEPIAPMLAKLTRDLPEGEGLFYEPKWDGFRCIVFRDNDSITLASRNEKPLDRYFPELVESLRANLPNQCVLDGEIVIVGQAGLDFDALTNRIHPAASRIKLLAESTPASFVAFDLLAIDEQDLMGAPYTERRARLEEVLSAARAPIYLTPATNDPSVASDWFSRFEGAGLDGVIVKPGDLAYLPDKRANFKVKHERTADCVVAGFRWHKEGGVVGSLLLGLYDDAGQLHHVGVASGFSAARRKEFVEELAPFQAGATDDHPWIDDVATATRVPGATSRWSAGKNLDWEPLRAELVVEVAYGQLQGDRFRHATSFVRWRSDRTASSCRYDQLDVPVPIELQEIFSG
jgi:ATP-dependent DNA ligase